MRRVRITGAAVAGVAFVCVLAASLPGGQGADAASTSGSDVTSDAAGPSLSPDAIQFGWADAAVKPTGLVQHVTVRDAGDAPSAVQAIALSKPFQLTADTCTGTTLAPASTCTVDVAWNPVKPARSVGVLVVETSTGRTSIAVSGAWPVPLPQTCFSSDCNTSGDPVVAAVPQAEKLLADCDALAKTAVVQYPATLAMTVGQNEPIKVTAAAGGDSGQPAPSPSDPALAAVALDLSCEVRARLYNQDFDISPSQDWQESSFLGTRQVEWLWKVETQRTGQQDLVLEIQSTPIISGMRLGSTGPPPYQLAIDVRSVSQGVGATTTNFFRRVVDYPLIQGFGSLAAVVTGVGASRRWVRSRRKARAAAPAPVTAPPGPEDGVT